MVAGGFFREPGEGTDHQNIALFCQKPTGVFDILELSEKGGKALVDGECSPGCRQNPNKTTQRDCRLPSLPNRSSPPPILPRLYMYITNHLPHSRGSCFFQNMVGGKDSGSLARKCHNSPGTIVVMSLFFISIDKAGNGGRWFAPDKVGEQHVCYIIFMTCHDISPLSLGLLDFP
ncbi:hypothetical protein VTK26DRAFT_946 [Humicola hyalothermophila]